MSGTTPPSRRPARRRFVLTVLALVVGACSGGDAAPSGARPDQLPVGDALTSLLVERGVSHSTEGSARTGVVFWDDVDRLEAKKPVVIEEIRPLHIDDGLELLEAPVSFLRSRGRGMRGPDGVGSSHRGNFCTDRWPPRARIGIYSSRNLPLGAGDFIVPAFVTRARRAGDWSASGLRIIYRQGGRRYQQTTRTFELSVSVRDTDEELAGLKNRCNDPHRPTGFLGGTAAPETEAGQQQAPTTTGRPQP